MEINKLTIFTATQKARVEDTDLYKSLQEFKIDSEVNLQVAEENKLPLTEIYNTAIDNAIEDDADVLILVHDDVSLDHDPVPKLRKLFDRYDLVGVAGPSQITLQEPALWHIMGGGWSGKTIHGAVAHGSADNKQITNFGPYPHKVVMIDGVFMALSREVMRNIRFDETNPCGFHFYDLQYSLDAAKQGYRVGVGDIYLTHGSPGLREYTQDWKNGQSWFLQRYGQ